jgi:hypothetical protein
MSVNVKSVKDGFLREFISFQDNSIKIGLRLEFPVKYPSVTDFRQIQKYVRKSPTNVYKRQVESVSDYFFSFFRMRGVYFFSD